MKRKTPNSKFSLQIDDNLKRAYDNVANEELPSRLTDLLDQLRAQDVDTKKGGAANDQ